MITDAAAGARIPQQAVRDLATWMTAFRDAAREVAPDVHATSVRGCTALMADALRDAGFYRACDEAEAPSQDLSTCPSTSSTARTATASSASSRAR